MLLLACVPVTLPSALLGPVSSSSSSCSSSLATRRSSATGASSFPSSSFSAMQTSYRLPNPLPPLPVRKGVRGRRPKLQTLALLKAAAEAAAAAAAGGGDAHGSSQGTGPPLAPRPHKKRGPKPGSKVRAPGGRTAAQR